MAWFPIEIIVATVAHGGIRPKRRIAVGRFPTRQSRWSEPSAEPPSCGQCADEHRQHPNFGLDLPSSSFSNACALILVPVKDKLKQVGLLARWSEERSFF
jgi:hypothetical protein